MAIDPPYRLDPLQNPVNVKWGDGEGNGINWWEAPTVAGVGSSWITSHVSNETGDGAHAFAGTFSFSSINQMLDDLTLVPIRADFIAIHQVWQDAFNAWLFGGQVGPYPKIPYIKATFPIS